MFLPRALARVMPKPLTIENYLRITELQFRSGQSEIFVEVNVCRDSDECRNSNSERENQLSFERGESWT
jgi:hypothetical protein